jgi:ribulose-5-phosphate 4-epimerase/fuculose-1-phosphate aldolase
MHEEREIRSEIVEVLRCMWERGYANTTGVSISVRADGDRIIVDQSGTGFRRCKVTEGDLLVINLEGDLLEDAPNGARRRAPANVIIHTEYYKANPLARACVHCHAPYTQVFSCEKRDIHPYTLQSVIMGVIPCIVVDDGEYKEKFRRENISLSVPSGLHNRPDVFYVMREVANRVVDVLKPRDDEMKIHGLAITHFQHGIFVFGRNLGEAFDNLERAEANARAILLSGILH